MKTRIQNRIMSVANGNQTIVNDLLSNFGFDWDFDYDKVDTCQFNGNRHEHYSKDGEEVFYTVGDSLHFNDNTKDGIKSGGYVIQTSNHMKQVEDCDSWKTIIIIGHGAYGRIKKIYVLDGEGKIEKVAYKAYNINNFHNWVTINERYAAKLFEEHKKGNIEAIDNGINYVNKLIEK